MTPPAEHAPRNLWQSGSRLRDNLLVLWSALGVILPCLIPNFSPAALLLSIVMPLLLTDRTVLKRNLLALNPIVLLLFVGAVYLTINIVFAPATDNAVGAVVTAFAAAIAVYVCGSAFAGIDAHDLKLMARGLVYGALAVAAVFLVEYMSRMSLQRALQHLAETARLPIRIEVGTWDQPHTTHMSRNLAILVILGWSAQAFAIHAFRAEQRRLVIAALLLLTGLSAALSPSATAKMGFIAGAVAWTISAHAPRFATIILYVGWVVASLGCIPLAHLIHKLRLYDLAFIGSSGRHRMMIWSASAEWFWRHPLLGLGVGGARVTNLNAELNISAPGIQADPLNWHAHNIFIQTWFETGAIGGLLLCLLGLLVLRAASQLPGQVRPFALATFTSILFIGLTGFSVWAPWYLAAYGLAGVFLMLAVAINRAGSPLPQRVAG